jgi:hypothetical protein
MTRALASFRNRVPMEAEAVSQMLPTASDAKPLTIVNLMAAWNDVISGRINIRG